MLEDEKMEMNAQQNPELDWELNPLYPSEADLEFPEAFGLELDYFDSQKQEDKLWQARTGLDEESLCAAIETIIFMSDKPVSLQKLKTLIDEDLPLRVLHEAISKLQEEYEVKHHGIRLVEVADGFQLRTKATYSKYVQDLYKIHSLVLTPTALEVLAIIAYKQPVAKTEVDKIRGVDSGHIVRGLMDKRLVKVVGRSDELGRSVQYGTTPEFLEVFNLANIEALPSEHELAELVEDGIGKISDIQNIVKDGEKASFVFDDMDELNNLSDSIKGISSSTEFTESITAKKSSNPEEPKKSAFDILEEFLDKQLIENANKESLTSEMLAGVADPQVVHDLTEGPFNAPDVEDEDDFQMIDLETGLPIEDEDSDRDEELQKEAKELSAALDKAFEDLNFDSDNAELAKELKEELFDLGVSDQEEGLEKLKEQISQAAGELDLDLDFLKESFEDSENSSEDLHEE